MPSKPLAYILLVVACMLAAGVGAFIATYQPTRAAVSAPPQSAGPAAKTPAQPVVAARPATTFAAPLAPVSAAPPPPKPTSSPAAAGERHPSPNPVQSRQNHDGSSRHAGAAVAPRPPANPQPDVRQAEPPSVPSVPMTQGGAGQGGVDPNPQAQRLWPGTPAPQPPVQQLPVQAGGGEMGRAEPEMAREEPVRPWLEVGVPAESVIGLQLESTISTENARVEDPVGARVTRDVRVGGRVVIPAGTEAIGLVTFVERGGRMKERARLGFRFNTLVFPDRSRVSISTDTIYRVSESPAQQSSAKIGGAAIGGAIIGAILGGGRGAAIGGGIGAASGAAAAMSSDRVAAVVPAGTTISVRTQETFFVTIEK
jgi:hypothetical protein